MGDHLALPYDFRMKTNPIFPEQNFSPSAGAKAVLDILGRLPRNDRKPLNYKEISSHFYCQPVFVKAGNRGGKLYHPHLVSQSAMMSTYQAVMISGDFNASGKSISTDSCYQYHPSSKAELCLCESQPSLWFGLEPWM